MVQSAAQGPSWPNQTCRYAREGYQLGTKDVEAEARPRDAEKIVAEDLVEKYQSKPN